MTDKLWILYLFVIFHLCTEVVVLERINLLAYANRKHHPGWMCTGVTSGFAAVKLSGSLKMYGSFIIIIVIYL